MNTINPPDINEILDKVYDWSKQQDYKGYNKHDGLNSPVLRILLGWAKWPRIIAVQAIMRFPVNLRPFLFTAKTYNPKGIALFTQGLLYRHQTTGKSEYLSEAEELLVLLEDIASPGDWQGICWGYHYPWQDPGFYASTNTPNAVVSCFVLEAFIHAYRVTNNKKYLNIVDSGISFLTTHLCKLKETDSELCLSYMPLKMSMRVMDVSILIAAVIAQYNELSGSNKNKEIAKKLLTYVINQQTECGAWFYTDPPDASHITHDNYHTGFILDALNRYVIATGESSWGKKYQSGLDFYAHRLFNKNGSPRWMYNKDFPHDIHGAAQGIITFSRHSNEYQTLVDDIIFWVINEMYHKDGRFFYQKTKFFKKKFTLLRWCNAWMFKALSENLYYKNIHTNLSKSNNK